MPDEIGRRGGTADLLRQDRPETDDYPEHTDDRDARAVNGRTDGAPEESPLLNEEQLRTFRERWEESQRDFVDEPRRSVESADQLVADLVRLLAEQFASERATLETQWDRGEDVSTDELRTAFQRYRAFFNRLLEV